ncbi:MAG: 16S rRNA (adenine(1518)-N(6)/adenine(1519)-N(6))-dimethyltransferase RsmA [Sphingobacteriia bacterium]|nr:16S rRNA (adenine(1518)-N(6)/adenine(1519)-N(6))-dimethyltransferase RsmA [Sphingobacteriia bacterium]NCC39660.1 16S rRNA (adenine(1518)-N(6)/adenine(1519)-N(6))-dimethyltransferase RsmA [Gammaproteobacteria bacterium]
MEHQPRKRFGQNFLRDDAVIDRIQGAIAPKPGEHLIEIGPGEGAITRGLLMAAGTLDVIELDRDLVGPLGERLGALGDLRIHQGDALRIDLASLVPPGTRLRLVGNLPYNISTPLLFRFIEQLDCIHDMHLMLQQEVAERIAADPGSKAYGRLSVMVQTRCSAETLFKIPPEAFRPPPKVTSAFLRLRPHRPPRVHIDDPERHARIVAAAFNQRRKTLRNSLSGLLDEATLSALGIDPRLRAEQLDVASFARLANARPA